MRPPRSAFFIVFMLAAGCAKTPEQPSAATPAATHDAHPATPAARITSCSAISARITTAIKTSSDEAQKVFRRGLTLLYGFNHEEAFRSFERAAALDATSPHAALGDVAGARHQLQRHREHPIGCSRPTRISHARSSSRKRQRRGARLRRCPGQALRGDSRTMASSATVKRRIPRRWARCRRSFPTISRRGDALRREHDEPAPVEALHNAQGVAEPGTEQIVRHARRRLEAQSGTSGREPLFDSRVEASRTPERAEVSAKRLETLVPAAGHLVHMPAHIWMRTGEYQAAVKTNADAALLDEKYVKQTGATGL
jgi:hypothetical protein